MKKLFLTILAILFTGLVLIGLIDTVVSTPSVSVAGKEVSSNISEARNSSASAMATITMYAVDDN